MTLSLYARKKGSNGRFMLFDGESLTHLKINDMYWPDNMRIELEKVVVQFNAVTKYEWQIRHETNGICD